ncbi:hypothetical protein [Cohnella zeiphila]|uniref:Uncharacterized protein n=1 Tax=Cohnella zeiphila TaxID=2761120 RepID=A0A7X0SL50_9BACL|nr:hypothetical protein [Cohnella zeiphila]MBB6731884.1 hypothetical protein [Cohnella zeiphila]
MDGNKLYIRIDNQQRIIDGYAEWQTEKRNDDEILITESGPRQFNLYWADSLYVEDGKYKGQYRFKWTDGQRVERTQEELDAEWAARPPAPPSLQDQINQITVTLGDFILGGM